MNRKLITTGILAATTYTASVLGNPKNDPNIDRPNPEEVLVGIVAEYDANADNLMNATELEAAIAGIHEKRKEKIESLIEERRGDREIRRFGDRHRPWPGPPPASEIAARLIENLDANGDEQLDTEEMRRAVRALKPKGPRGMRGRGHHRGGAEQTAPSNTDLE